MGRWIVIAACVAIAGCATTTYEFRPPQTEEGRTCTVQCDLTRQTCRADELQNALDERGRCEMQNNLRRQSCLGRAKTDNEKKDCPMSTMCFDSANTERCEERYRDCYTGCGGFVIPHVDD